jgi:hypothetical protein
VVLKELAKLQGVCVESVELNGVKSVVHKRGAVYVI